jgi:hypothetical protein
MNTEDPTVPALCVVRADLADGTPFAAVAKLLNFRTVGNMSALRILKDGKRERYEATEWECESNRVTEQPPPRRLLRRKICATREAAEAHCLKWKAEAEAKRREHERKAKAAQAEFAAKRAALLPAPRDYVRPISNDDQASAENAVRFALTGKWPRSMAAIARHETDPHKLALAYAVDVAELTGEPDDSPLRVTGQVLAQLSAAVRNHARQTRKLQSVEIDLCVALNWFPLRWSELSERELETALRAHGIYLKAAAARRRAGRLKLPSLKPPGPKPGE